MATRSLIGYANPNGTITYVYCHHDGYLSHNGRILLNFYNTFERVKQLVDGGQMSSLGERPDAPAGHSYKTPVDGHTVYYGRDRGETNAQPTIASCEVAFYGNDPSYKYLFKDGKWFFRKGSVAVTPECRFSELTP